MHSRATDRRSASKCQGKWPDQSLDQAFGLPEVLVASCKSAGETRTLMPVWDLSGESQVLGNPPIQVGPSRIALGRGCVPRALAIASFLVYATTIFALPQVRNSEFCCE